MLNVGQSNTNKPKPHRQKKREQSGHFRKGNHMKVINLTAHEVTLSNGMVSITFPPSGNIARVDARTERSTIKYKVTDEVELKLPTVFSTEAKITNLPKEEPGVYYIVSNYVAQTAKRGDLLAPSTDNSAERDENGNVISVKGFQQYFELNCAEV